MHKGYLSLRFLLIFQHLELVILVNNDRDQTAICLLHHFLLVLREVSKHQFFDLLDHARLLLLLGWVWDLAESGCGSCLHVVRLLRVKSRVNLCHAERQVLLRRPRGSTLFAAAQALDDTSEKVAASRIDELISGSSFMLGRHIFI